MATPVARFTKFIAPAALALSCLIHLGSGSRSDESSKPAKEAPKKAATVKRDEVQALIDAGKYDEAIKKGEQLIEAEQSAQNYTMIGFAERKRGRWDESIEAYKKALAKDGTYAPAKEYLAVAYLNKKEYKKAQDLYVDLQHTDPKLAEMLKNEATKMGQKW